jgi:hypothetical protein
VAILNENLVFWEFFFFFKKKIKELVIEHLFFKMVKKFTPNKKKDFFAHTP